MRTTTASSLRILTYLLNSISHRAEQLRHCQDASFEPSTINFGSGVRPVNVRKKKKGREGMG